MSLGRGLGIHWERVLCLPIFMFPLVLGDSESPPSFFPLPATLRRGLLLTFFSPRSFCCCYRLRTGVRARVPSQCFKLKFLFERRGILAECWDLSSHFLTSRWLFWSSFHSPQRVAFGSSWKADLLDVGVFSSPLQGTWSLSSSWGEGMALMLCACVVMRGEIQIWAIVIILGF